jgi:hypothetical protein
MKLAKVSEHRLVYWQTDVEKSRFLRVSRDRDDRSDRWAVFDGEHAWNGEVFAYTWVRPESYQWGEAEALEIAEGLARAMNAEIIAVMERRFPGQFLGGPFDLAAKEETP